VQRPGYVAEVPEPCLPAKVLEDVIFPLQDVPSTHYSHKPFCAAVQAIMIGRGHAITSESIQRILSAAELRDLGVDSPVYGGNFPADVEYAYVTVTLRPGGPPPPLHDVGPVVDLTMGPGVSAPALACTGDVIDLL